MKKHLALLVLLACIPRAEAQVFPPSNTTYTSISYAGASTITTGGVAQAVTWTLPKPLIKCVQNPSSASESLYVAFGGTASTSTTDLVPGAQMCWAWRGTVSVYAATTAHAFMAVEAQ